MLIWTTTTNCVKDAQKKGAEMMQYTVNYTGVYYSDDVDGFNTIECDNFNEALWMLIDLVENGFDDAYLRNETYGSVGRYNLREEQLEWDP